MTRLCHVLRHALLATVGLTGLAATAQEAAPEAWAATTAFPPGTVLYTADDVGQVQVADRLFRVGDDGTEATPLASADCAPYCMVFAVRVGAADGRLTPTDAEREPGSWIVVLTREGTRVELDGVPVAQGKARLRVVPGDHELTFRFESGEVKTQHHSIPVATEVTAHQLPSRNAPPVIVPAVAAAATIPPDLIAGLLDGAESGPDDPATGWRMPEPAPVLAPIAERPVPPPLPPEPVAPPVVEAPPADEAPALGPPPADEVTRDAQPAGALACEVPVADLDAEATARIRSAEYTAARACLRRLRTEGDDPFGAQTRLSALEFAIADIEGEGAATRQYLENQRVQAEAAVELLDTDLLVDAASKILNIVQADPSAVALLEEMAHASSAGVEDVSLAFAFVPGTRATRTPSRLISDGVSELGFLLSTTEVTNAQFVAFLNTVGEDRDVPRTFHVRHPTALEHDRRDGWSVKDGMEGFPVVDATWHGANAYARWMGGRLPTQGEWIWAYQNGESAAAVGEPNLRPDTGRPSLAAAADGEADRLGLVHMLGNVWEWTHTDIPQPQQVPAAGGSYTTARQTLLSQLTQDMAPDVTNGHIGFRVLRTILPSN